MCTWLIERRKANEQQDVAKPDISIVLRIKKKGGLESASIGAPLTLPALNRKSIVLPDKT